MQAQELDKKLTQATTSQREEFQQMFAEFQQSTTIPSSGESPTRSVIKRARPSQTPPRPSPQPEDIMEMKVEDASEVSSTEDVDLKFEDVEFLTPPAHTIDTSSTTQQMNDLHLNEHKGYEKHA